MMTKHPQTTTDKNKCYSWQGINKNGQRVSGEKRRESIAMVKAELRKQGIKPTKVYKKSRPLFKRKQTKIKSLDITAFSRQLATLISAGIAIIQALTIVAKSVDNKAMQQLISSVKHAIASGEQLSTALKKYPSYFHPLYCNLIYAGEQSGTLDTMLNRLARYLEKTETLKKNMKKALTYPIAVILVAITVTSILLLYVIPQFDDVFQSFGSDLPWLTQLVIHGATLLQAWWWIILLIILAGFGLCRQCIKRSPKWALRVDLLLLHMPILGTILQQAIIVRFTRSLAITFSAGMPLVHALETIASSVGNRIYRNAIDVIASQVATGVSLQQAMQESTLFPNMVNQMIAIGEESGTLDTMLNKVADYYDEIVDAAVANLSSLLEPIIMVILAVIIGTIIIAMYLPIFQLGATI